MGQLAGIRFELGTRGRVAIEAKVKARQRGVASPDRAEALMLAIGKPVYVWQPPPGCNRTRRLVVFWKGGSSNRSPMTLKPPSEEVRDWLRAAARLPTFQRLGLMLCCKCNPAEGFNVADVAKWKRLLGTKSVRRKSDLRSVYFAQPLHEAKSRQLLRLVRTDSSSSESVGFWGLLKRTPQNST